ncbi:membrane-associated protease 1 [Enterocloster clostridioformis]|uniref:membrane-associated protease 1 n=1 Tax=Enterocloster aldenensis TaxID=358742 RepID=UPI00080C9E8F|nr:membrane-associated protease 1 [Enterocloster clostridioformis]ANU48226.1 membrane-associated protease 1 [Lachnoclostridium sp. YL32]OXE61964.1 membrane-associated protease 1 [Enterocloster clostridioformis]OXE69065.1 membrane-associated protease 1 [Enterocloster clostridioformis]QQR01999.1 membrane-associated protease 1 [Enterocloster clostridioformis]QQR02888.1 membrane-associated protease 1 [Enterocloster clostridioformis]
MSYRVRVEGMESFEIAKECVRSVKFSTDIPLDSNARTKDVGSTLTITGRILTAVDGDPFDSTRKLALWSAVPAEKSDCYRKVTVEHVAAGIMERKYFFPNSFVIDYKEDYGDVEGTGTFTLVLKQKKDKLANITVEGGYPAA